MTPDWPKILADLRVHRKAQVEHIDTTTLAAGLVSVCLDLYRNEVFYPALFAALVRGPNDAEAAGGQWTGAEPPANQLDANRIQALWMVETGRAPSMMAAYRAMNINYGD